MWMRLKRSPERTITAASGEFSCLSQNVARSSTSRVARAGATLKAGDLIYANVLKYKEPLVLRTAN
jgi:hypothetical protein